LRVFLQVDGRKHTQRRHDRRHQKDQSDRADDCREHTALKIAAPRRITEKASQSTKKTPLFSITDMLLGA
jgi:hypothetical protein